MLKGLERELNAVNVKLTGVAGKKISAAWKAGMAEADKQAKAAGIGDKPGSPAAGSFNLVDSSRAKVLLRETAGDLQKAVNSIKANTRKLVRQTHALRLDDAKLNQILAGGTIAGTPAATLMEFKKEVRKAAIEGNIITVNTRTGATMSFKPDDYAELVFQTKQAEATNIATLERLQAKQMFYVRIIGSHSANFCTAFVDKVFYTGPGEDPLGHFPHVRTLPRGGPPFHPRCTKRYVAFIPSLATADEIEKAKLTDDEKSLLNTDSSTAQKRFEAKPKAPPAPPVPANRAATVRQEATEARRTLREVETGYKATFDLLATEKEDLSAEINSAAERGDHLAVRDAADRSDDLTQRITDSVNQARKSGLALLQVSKPISTEYVLDAALGQKRKAVVVEGIEAFEKLIDRAAVPKLSIIARVPEQKVGMGDRSYYTGGKIHISTTADAGVVVHELAHQLEDTIPELHQAALDFLKRRTAGEKAKSMRSLTGNMNYKPHERAWEDDFFNPYVGKDYSGHATEILSMGIEAWWRNPFYLARIDPEFFEFLYKAFRGVYQ